MDTALSPVEAETRLAPERFRAELALKVDRGSGLLPPWTRWWPRDEVARVIPAGSLAQVEAECPRLPLSYFETSVRVPPGWAHVDNAYLAFGDTYADELSFAHSMRWPVARIPGGHLEFMWNPTRVADHIVDLLHTADP